MIGTIRVVFALLLVALVTIVLAPLQYSAVKLGWPRPTVVPLLWHRIALKALGVRVRVKGALSADRPLLIAANHVSWIDIVAIGATAPVSFIAKSETAGWPFAGWLARMQRTVFVEREKRRKAGEQASDIGRRLAAGDVMVLFAEGSTSDGNMILPFKSTLFGAAKMALDEGAAERVLIQPLAIAYTRLHGLPMSRRHRALVSWIGDGELVPHVKMLLLEGGVDVELHFGEPFAFDKATQRKHVASRAELQVRAMQATANRHPA